MSRRLVIAVGVAALVATSANAALLVRAQGSFSTFLSRLKYDPGGACTKPYRPYQKDKWAREQYLRDGRAYLSCLRAAADADVEYAQKVIEEGYREAAEGFVEEVRRGY